MLLDQETENRLLEEVGKGSDKAIAYLNQTKFCDEYFSDLVKSGKANLKDNGEFELNHNELSPEQIKQYWQFQSLWLRIQNDILNDFPPMIKDASREEIDENLNEIHKGSKKYIETVDEKVNIIEEKPEQSYDIGKLISSSMDEINLEFKEVRKAESKGLLNSLTKKLTNIFNKAVDAFNRHTREANKNEQKITDSLNKQKKELKDVQDRLKKYSDKIKEIELSQKIFRAETLGYSETELLAVSDKQISLDKEFESVNNAMEADKQFEELLKNNINFLVETRKEVRKDRWLPAALITSAYDSLSDNAPIIADITIKTIKSLQEQKDLTADKVKGSFAEISNNLSNLKNNIMDKLTSKVNFMGKKLSNAIEFPTKIVSTQWDKIGKKLAEVANSEIKQKKYLIKEIIDENNRKSLPVYKPYDWSDGLQLSLKPWTVKEKIEPVGEYLNEDTHRLIIKNRDLSGVDFSGKILKNVEFINCNLDGCNFKDCNFDYIFINHSSVNNSKFDNAVMRNCYFTDAKFDNCNFMPKFMNYVSIENCGTLSEQIKNILGFKHNIVIDKKSDISRPAIRYNDLENLEKTTVKDYTGEKNQEHFNDKVKNKNNELDLSKDDNDLKFIEKLIKNYGISKDSLEKAVTLVASALDEEDPRFKVELLNKVIKSDVYKNAQFNEKTETKEVARV